MKKKAGVALADFLSKHPIEAYAGLPEPRFYARSGKLMTQLKLLAIGLATVRILTGLTKNSLEAKGAVRLGITFLVRC
jgi:hypothetical protein